VSLDEAAVVSEAEPLLGLESGLADLVRIDVDDANALLELSTALERNHVCSEALLELYAREYFTLASGPDRTLSQLIKDLRITPTRDLAVGLTVALAFGAAWRSLGGDVGSYGRAVRCAVVAELLSYETEPLLSERAFTAGLLANVGPELGRLVGAARDRARSAALWFDDGTDSLVRAAGRRLTRAAMVAWRVPHELRECVPGATDVEPRSRSAVRTRAMVSIAMELVYGVYEGVDDHLWLDAGLEQDIVSDVLAEAEREMQKLRNLLP